MTFRKFRKENGFDQSRRCGNCKHHKRILAEFNSGLTQYVYRCDYQGDTAVCKKDYACKLFEAKGGG